jgi:hypothetical protein
MEKIEMKKAARHGSPIQTTHAAESSGIATQLQTVIVVHGYKLAGAAIGLAIGQFLSARGWAI